MALSDCHPSKKIIEHLLEQEKFCNDIKIGIFIETGMPTD